MFRYVLQLPPMLTLLLILPAPVRAQAPNAGAVGGAVAEVRAAIRRYDDALRRSDVAAVEQFWAAEYTFVNPRGELVSRAARLANLRAGRTAFDSLAPAPQEEQIRTYGDEDLVAVQTTLLTLGAATAVRLSRAGTVPWPSGCVGPGTGSRSRVN